MKEIIENSNSTYTIRMTDGWSVTANITQLEKIFNECFDQSILYILKVIK